MSSIHVYFGVTFPMAWGLLLVSDLPLAIHDLLGGSLGVYGHPRQLGILVPPFALRLLDL